MAVKPILFRPEMVNKIRSYQKTQTRRIYRDSICPYQKDDSLYVRESFATEGKDVYYRADHIGGDDFIKWKPSIHMPKALSRVHLLVVDVRKELLWDISSGDARKEGFSSKKDFLCYWDLVNAKRCSEKNPVVSVIEFEFLPF